LKILAVSHAAVIDVNQLVYCELEARNNTVTLAVPNHWRHEYTAGAVEPRRLDGFRGEIIELPVARPGSPPLHLYTTRLRPHLRRTAPDVVYIEEEPYSVAAWQWALASHGEDVPTAFYTAQNIIRRYPLPFRVMERAVWQRCCAATAASGGAAGALRGRGFSGRLEVVPLSVDVNAFRPGQDAAKIRRELGLRPRVVAFLGRLSEEKGVRVLLSACKGMIDRTKVTLLLIGGGPLADACRAVDGVVIAEGVTHANVPRYLAAADVLAMPSLTTDSWREQFGRAAIEAMACGIPVVASDSGHLPALIEDTGGGVVVPEGDAVALRLALASLLDDPELRCVLGASGRRAVEERYSPAARARLLGQLLSEISSTS
jgi:glycosyltransferase involved in cell wall biosynthesis